MQDQIKYIREKAKAGTLSRIVLPEGHEPRVLEAAAKIIKSKISEIIILGDVDSIKSSAEKSNIDLSGAQIIDPLHSDKFEKYSGIFYELRKHKGMTLDAAREAVKDKLYFAALMVKDGAADGMVAGASHTTKDVARATILCIPMGRSSEIVSSAFIMIVDNKKFGEGGVFVFSDCGIVPDPTSEELAMIAVSASEFAGNVLNMTPRVAMLSYSTKGSGKGQSVDKVANAVKIVRGMAPGLLVDGEMQADAAIVPEVCDIKSPGSPIKGRANVLIFPNLDSGNVSYKLVQRLAGAKAVGPVMLGTSRPASDLSRGCSSEDIVDTVALVSVMARQKEAGPPERPFGRAGQARQK